MHCVPTHDIIHPIKSPHQGNGQKRKDKTMPKEDDRHLGRRENIWFPFDEHDAMLKAMEALKEQNKSNFIRSAVRNFIDALNAQKGK